MPDTGNIHFTIVDGRRQLLPPDTQVLVRLLNGAQPRTVWAAGGDITITGIPFTDTGNDAYNVFTHASGYDDAVTPYRVPLIRNGTAEVALLATPSNGRFHFHSWQDFQTADPRIRRLITNGAPGDPAKRYADTLEAQPMELGALLTLASAICDIPLDDRSGPLDYYWRVIWDLLPTGFGHGWMPGLPTASKRWRTCTHSRPKPILQSGTRAFPAGSIRTRSWKQDCASTSLTCS